jgi:uncharacterized integral membrane protein
MAQDGYPQEQQRPEGRRPSNRAAVRLIVLAVIVIAFLVFLFQNGADVRIHFLPWTAKTSVAWAIVVAGVFGLIIGVLLPRLRRLL